MNQLSLPLQGIIPPLVTPLRSRDQIDIEGTERLIEHVISGGVQGLFLLGTSGEAPSLSHDVQREFVKIAVNRIAGRVPVLVGITDTSMSESISFAAFAAECGADAVVLATPHYFSVNQKDLRRYVEEIAVELPLPFLLYNMPSHTKVAYEIETVRALLSLPKFLGVKDSSGSMLYFNKLIELKLERSDLTVLMGPEELMAQSVLMGGDGGICGGANLVPDWYVSLYKEARQENLREVHRMQQQVMRLSKSLYEVGDPPNSYLTGIKAALGIVGLCSDRLCEPIYSMDDQHKAIIRQHLDDLGLLQQLEPSALNQISARPILDFLILMSQSNWYQDGLSFACTQCGNCCTGSPGFVWVTDEEIQQIAEFLDKPVGEIRLMYTRQARRKVSLTEYANGDCVFFDGNRRTCQIYPVRPMQCRTWPFWKSNLDSPDRWEEVARDCPGIGKGELVPLELIEERLSKTDL